MRKLTSRQAAPLLRALLLTVAALACLKGLPATAQDGGPTTPVPTNTPPAASATSQTPTPPGLTIHVVQRDENLFRIAQQYGVTVDAIAQANGLTDKSLLQVGQRLLIPGVAPDASAAQSAPGSSDPAASSGSDPGAGGVPGVPDSTVVQPGDSLFSLSVRYGMDETALARINKILNPNQPLFAGLSLAVQTGSQGYTPINSGSIYVAQPGDTVYRVALRYGVSLALLVKVNRLNAIPVIFAGERLIIPGPANGPTLDDLAAPFDRVTMLPSQPEQGRTMEWVVNMAVPSKLSGHFMGKTLAIYGDPTRQHFIIPFGIDAFAKPGIYALDVTSTDDQGKAVTLTRNIMVEDGHYPSEEITLPPDQKDLLDPNVTQPEADHVFGIVDKFTQQNFLNGPMGLPCAAPVTSQFGTRRSYDGGPYNQWHMGTDFAALPGTPIYAPAGGVVVMAETLHVRGNATIIDHGRGIFTGYWHQSEIDVKVGDIVHQGQIIGLTGATGRATGPHLHWEMFVEGVQVDPLEWTKVPFQ